MAKNYTGETEIEKEFIKVFQSLSYRHNPWTVWQDFVNMFACALSNSVDYDETRWVAREDSYMDTIQKYTADELQQFVKLVAHTTAALEENPDQDFLGNLYMRLDFGNDWHGQFFTPWSVASMMAKISIGSDFQDKLEEQGFVSVNDPACGAGCMLIAFARACAEDPNVSDYQSKVLFVAQDLDKVVAQMCYIQLSLLECAGYVIVGNTLTQPPCGDVLFPEVAEGCELWLTPMYFSEIWAGRLMARRLRYLFAGIETAAATDKGETAEACPSITPRLKPGACGVISASPD